jgi:hypothetical protein
MDRAEFLGEYRKRVNEYARRRLQGDDPAVSCGAEWRQVEADDFPDRNADPWGYLHAMSRVVAKNSPI